MSSLLSRIPHTKIFLSTGTPGIFIIHINVRSLDKTPNAFDIATQLYWPLKMWVWIRLELLCIYFDGWQVTFNTWPIPISQFKDAIIDRALQHYKESSCIIILDDVYKLRGDINEILNVQHEKCRPFIPRGKENPTQVETLAWCKQMMTFSCVWVIGVVDTTPRC